MPDYHIFGGILRSHVEFPELEPSTAAAPTWELSRVSRPRPVSALVPLGRENVEANVEVTLASHDEGLRLVFDDTGTFDVLDGGRAIEWTPPPAPRLDAVRKDLLGRVFAVALGQQGCATLHGSAVAIAGTAVVFLAPKFHGKSTTATAMVDAGARLLADDLVPVTLADAPMVLPSVPVVQLWQDSAERVGGRAATLPAEGPAPKRQIKWREPDRNVAAPVPLAAVYLLAPRRPDAATSVSRHRLAGVAAALAMLGQAKVGALIGVQRQAELMQALATISEKVPVYRLEIPRDFERLTELTSSLLAWHPPSPPLAAPTRGST